MGTLLFRNCLIIDNSSIAKKDILIEKGKIKQMSDKIVYESDDLK